MLAFSQSCRWQLHDIFGLSVLSSHIFVGIFKRHSPASLPQVRLQETPADSFKERLATGPAALGTHSDPVACMPLCLAHPHSPPRSAPLHSDILKVHHFPLRSERSMNTPLCFPWRRRQRRCQVLYC